MRSTSLGVLAVLLIAGPGGVLCAAVQSELAPPAAQAAKLDKGDLDPAWFDSTRPLEFHRTGPVDYLWVKPGLDLRGKLLHLDRWEAALADPDDEAKDRIKVRELTREMPQLCLEQWKEILKEDYACSLSDGVIRVVGRFADVNVTSGMSFAWPSATFDIKFIDKQTGDLLVAIHHRTVQRAKPGMKHWFRKVAEAMNRGLEGIYAAGEKATE